MIWPIAGVAILAVLAIAFIDVLVNGGEAILTAVGLGAFLIVAVALADARIALGKPQLTTAFARHLVAWHLLAIAVFGVLALFNPSWTAGDVDFSEVSLGGEFGRLLVTTVPGVIVWLASWVGWFCLAFPGRARRVSIAVGVTGQWIVSLDLPQRTARALGGFFTLLMPVPRERPEPDLLSEPYVPTLDEEWIETEATIVEEEPEEPEPARDPAAGMLVTTDPDDEPEGHQQSLPMGRPAGRGWELPPVASLAEAASVEARPLDNDARAALIVETLASFGVDARVVSINQGPTVTQFGVEPGWEVKTRTVAIKDELGRPVLDKNGRPATREEIISRVRVRVNRITSLANDLALALAAPTIRIEAPVPGKPIVGIEVPNTTTSLVSLRSVIESTAFQKVNARTRLALALGKGVSGEPVATDLARMPHLLIAGATGSGKSVCINSIIASFLLHNTPEELRLVLVDPKRVELTTYNKVPHLAFSKVIVDMDEVVGTLQAVIHEMDSRYRRFAEAGVRNIDAYNGSPVTPHKLPHWVVVIDELADLMMAAPYEVERQICRLAQLARATGIHLIVATQRPSVDVITGLIKANFPTRIAFAVSSQVDSRTIIDQVGAEKLLGRGDMLFMATDAAKPKRIQGSYVSDAEIEKITTWWANDRFRHLAPDKLDHLIDEAATEATGTGKHVEDDPLYEAARELAGEHSRISTSLLQRRLHIGYPRAARLIDMLEEEGVVGPSESGQSRPVLASTSDDDYGSEAATFSAWDDGEDTAQF
jgi:S-DNA-T family DNA segregation ATPase FtsK/SpoIIIE